MLYNLVIKSNNIKMKGFHKLTFILLIIGGLNWGLEVFGYGVGSFLPMGISKIIYLLVAVSALVEIFSHKSMCKECEVKAPMQGPQM
jgi:uncharacterized membrane protein YuzA (DUF378 family)